MENLMDYPNRALANAILAVPRIAQFITDFVALDEQSLRMNELVARTLMETIPAFDKNLLADRLAALELAHDEALSDFLAANMPEGMQPDESREVAIFKSFLYDSDFVGRELILDRFEPGFFNGHTTLTLGDKFTVYLWAAFDCAERPGDGLLYVGKSLDRRVLLTSKGWKEMKLSFRVRFLRKFHRFIHYTMDFATQYRSAQGKAMLRLAYKNMANDGGHLILTTCGERTAECNETLDLTEKTLLRLLAMSPQLEPAIERRTTGFYCMRERCQRAGQFLLREDRSEEFIGAYCSYLCFGLHKRCSGRK